VTPLTRRQLLAGGAGAAAALALGACGSGRAPAGAGPAPDWILHGGRFTTLDPARPAATAVAIADGRFLAVGDDTEVLRLAGPATRRLDLGGRAAIPGLIDSHIHVIRGGLSWSAELRWEGVPSLDDALRLLRERAQRTQPPQWVRVVGGWSRFQFAERRLPTLEEINAASGEVPVFVLHLYDRALLNAAALRAVGITRETPDPPGGEIVRDRRGNPTGMLIARPNAYILYSTLAAAPKLAPEDQALSTRHFLRELNRLGVTSVVDAGGGFQNYPDDYAVIRGLHERGELTLRIAYTLFTQRPGKELDDFRGWAGQARPGDGDDWLRLHGAGEMLVFSAADFEDFREPRPTLPRVMEDELAAVAGFLVRSGWPFRLHATYDESITRMLDALERVDREAPLRSVRWLLDHAETISPRNLERVAALGGGIAVQHRMAFQGEDFVARYGAAAAAEAPPLQRMRALGIPVGAGTDATRVASYHSWVSLSWLATGRTVGGLGLTPPAQRLDREQALRLWTEGSAWVSGDEGRKGRIAPGFLADLAVPSADYFAVPDDAIAGLESVLTVAGGRVVWAAAEFAALAPPPLPSAASWAPAKDAPLRAAAPVAAHAAHACACAGP
jgi:predicted amidohydrolase YtcJ